VKITIINRMMGINRGGGEYFDLNIARALRKLGAEVRFVVGCRRHRSRLPLDEFEVTYVRTPYLRSIEYRYNMSRSRLARSLAWRARALDDLIFARAVYHHLRNDRDTDIYQFCGLPCAAAMFAKMGRKAVTWWRGPPSKGGLATVRDCAGSFTHGISLIKARELDPTVARIDPGCDTGLFSPPPRRQQSKKRCRFLYVGRCIPIKNLGFLIDGFARAQKHKSEISLAIIGDGEQLPMLREKIDAMGLGDSVVLSGTQAGSTLAQSYREADCFTLVSHFESFSMVVQEAMSSGLPLILGKVGYLPYWIREFGAGTLVNPSNIDELAKAMVWWTEHPAERLHAGKKNRCAAEQHFSWDTSANNLLAFYDSIL